MKNFGSLISFRWADNFFFPRKLLNDNEVMKYSHYSTVRLVFYKKVGRLCDNQYVFIDQWIVNESGQETSFVNDSGGIKLHLKISRKTISEGLL